MLPYLLLLTSWTSHAYNIRASHALKADLSPEAASQGEVSQTVLSQTSGSGLVTDYLSVADGFWGEWQGAMDAPKGYLACGMALRDEPGQGAGDDSAINAIKVVYCSISKWSEQTIVDLNTGIWGNWKSTVMCPTGYFINAVQAKVEANQGSGDDSALNALRIRCKHPLVQTAPQELSLEYGGWGSWGKWLEFPSSYICGGQVRFQWNQGSGDDTALNGVRFRFCKYVNLKDVEFKYFTNQVKRNPTPEVVKDDVFVNNSLGEGTSTFEYSEKKTETKTWENMYGSALGIEIETEASIPLIASADVTVSAETKIELKNGGSTSTEKTMTAKKEIKIPPCSSAKVSYLVTKDSVSIPYEAKLTFEDGTVETTSGLWKGTVYYNEHVEVNTVRRSDFCT